MKPFVLQIIIYSALSFLSSNLMAQVPDDLELSQDSTLLDDTKYTAKKSEKKEGFLSMFEGNPGKAALYSAILPGAGQVYNKKWLKAPIVWGLEGTAIGIIIFYSQTHNLYHTKYQGMARGEISSWNGFDNATALKSARDTLRKRRDYSYLALGIVHVLNIADAFVDRHLIEFDVSEDLSFQFGPAAHGLGITMSLH